jgi:hypothetical protein
MHAPSPPCDNDTIWKFDHTDELNSLLSTGTEAYRNAQYSKAALLLTQLLSILHDKHTQIYTQVTFMAATAHINSGHPEIGRRLLTILRTALLANNSTKRSPIMATLLITLAKSLCDSPSDFRAQIHLLERETLPLLDSLYGKDNLHIDTLTARALQARAYGMLNQQDIQISLLSALLVNLHGMHPSDSSDMITNATEEMATAYGMTQDYTKQQQLLTTVLVRKEHRYGPNDPNRMEIASTLHALAFTYGKSGNHLHQLTLLKRCLRIETALLGTSAIQLVTTYLSLSQVFLNMYTADSSDDNTFMQHKYHLHKAIDVLRMQPDVSRHQAQIDSLSIELNNRPSSHNTIA